MVWPTVTELPSSLEPATPDTFVQDLNELTATPPSPHPRTESHMFSKRLAGSLLVAGALIAPSAAPAHAAAVPPCATNGPAGTAYAIGLNCRTVRVDGHPRRLPRLRPEHRARHRVAQAGRLHVPRPQRHRRAVPADLGLA